MLEDQPNLSFKSFIDLETIYDKSKNNNKKLRIFGKIFVNKNKNKCKIIYKNKKYKLKEYFEDLKCSKINENQVKLILRMESTISDMSHMFDECLELESISEIQNKYNENNMTSENLSENNLIKRQSFLNKNNIQLINNMFYNCQSLKALPDISNWNTSNVSDLSYMFYDCNLLLHLPNLSKWNISNIIDINSIFYNCKSLLSLPDISKWNTKNIKNMSFIFYNCKSLLSLPDISKWNTKNVKNMSFIFYNCKSLVSLPDISKWNTNKVSNMKYMFYNCYSLLSLPDISKWDTSQVEDMEGLFGFCLLLNLSTFLACFNSEISSDF